MSEQKEAALLLWMEGEEIKARWLLSKPVTSIGRWEDNDIVIDDRWISRHHARIRREKDQYILEDLDSKNGTVVNGQRIFEPVPLTDGDEIQLTPLRQLTFVDYGATAPLPGETQGPVLELDRAARQVTVRDTLLSPPLSAAQFALLSLLAEEPGRVYSREEVIEVVWPEDEAEGISDEAIDALVRRIRLRLREIDADHEYLVTVRGYGFKLDLE
jgi:DNA-binding response OmpR family regulator